MSSSLPLVSVCIPAYNHEKYITDCLKSLMVQTYKNLELLIIDDGSSDNTKQQIMYLMPQLKQRFVRVVFKSQKNQGTCTTINNLYKYVKGKYIYHIASDDMSKPESISKQVEFLQNNPDYGLVVGDNDIIDTNGKKCYWDEHRNNVYKINLATYKTFGDFLIQSRPDVNFNSTVFGTYGTLFRGNYIPNGYLFRGEILNKIGEFTSLAPLEDWWFMLQISKFTKLKYIDEILFSYRWHGTNTILNTEKIKKMCVQTKKYEQQLLLKLNFSKVLPNVKSFIRKEKIRELKHKYFYHKTQINSKCVNIKLFGLINVRLHKK